MNERNAFVATILAAPGDATARLVFADWLDERSDPRAGCVRLAARLRASYGPLHPDHSAAFWQTLGYGIEPTWWAEEALRLAREVQDKVGDGCKTAVLIALALSEATLLFPSGDDAGRAALLRLEAARLAAASDQLSVPVYSLEELRRCLTTAALGDADLAEALREAFTQAGKDGVITVTPGEATQLPTRARVTRQQGLRFPLGNLSGHEGRELRPAAVLVSLRTLQAEEVRRTLAASTRAGAGLLCCCGGVDSEGAELFREATQAGTAVLLVADPVRRVRDCFEDIAVATGARLIRPDEEGPVRITKTSLGRAGVARVVSGQLVIDEPSSNRRRNDWVTQLRERVYETTGDEQEWHSTRIAQLCGGVVTVEVCGASPPETEQLSGAGCGTLHAGRLAIASGKVPGGGVAYLRVGSACDDEPMRELLRWSLAEPIRVLASGTQLDTPSTLAALRADENLGIDLVRQELLPWQTDGPLDPTRVVRTVVECAIESAARAVEAGYTSSAR